MKHTFIKIAALGLFAAAVINLPMLSSAADPNPATAESRPHATRDILPFHGKVAALDTNAMTLTVGKHTIAVASDTRISKDGTPAALSDGAVGDRVGGAYKKSADGTWNATTINFHTPKTKEKKDAGAGN